MHKEAKDFFIFLLTLFIVMVIAGLIVDATGLESLLHNRFILLLYYMLQCGIAYWIAEVIKKRLNRKHEQREQTSNNLVK